MDMTEGQWLYMLTHIAVDDEEEFAKLCQKCKNKSKESRCNGCGEVKHSHNNESSTNESFDDSKFEELKSKYE